MRITEISVTKLFGVFDHTIPLNLDDHITIIHSENGFGKTTLLKMLHGLFNERYSELLSIPFQKFQVSFDDNSVLWIEKEAPESAGSQNDSLADDDIDKTEREEESQSSEITVNFSSIDMLEPSRFSLKSLHDSEESKASLPYILELSNAHTATAKIPSVHDVPESFIKLVENVEIRLIQTQRLQSFRKKASGKANYLETVDYLWRHVIKEDPAVSTVNEYAKELREIIQQKLADSASSSQRLDSTFPTRLVELMSNPDRPELTDDELQARLDKLDNKRSRLEDIGILDKEDKEVGGVSPSSKDMIDKTKDLLTLYVQDVENKLSVFDEIAEKTDLFRRMIDKRRFSHKKIIISKEEGFEFVTQDGETLPLTALSSGEQHEIVLLYQLLFKTKPNSLILIDEPEISLHIAWQQEFVQDLQEITRLSPFDILIATHSPDIIHNRWDLTVRLEEPVTL